MDLTNSETTTQPGQPALTVVLPTIDNYQRIQKTLTHLQAQTARSEIEVQIVASSEGALKLDPAVAEGFFDLRVIESWGNPLSRCCQVSGGCRGKG